MNKALACALVIAATGYTAEDNHGKRMYLRYRGSCHGVTGGATDR